MNDQLPVVIDGNEIQIRVPYVELYRAKSIPNSKWDRSRKIWWTPLIIGSARAVLDEFESHEIDVRDKAKLLEIVNHKPVDQPFPAHDFKNEPMKHQMRALNKCWGKRTFAFFMRMRTGKTFTTLMWAERLWFEEQIDAIWVVCPTSVKEVWAEEIKEHMNPEIPVSTFIMEAGKYNQAKKFIAPVHEGIKVMIFGVESFSQGNAYKMASEFVRNHKTIGIVDESHRIKTPHYKPAPGRKGKERGIATGRITAIGEHCAYKGILTGTPIAQGIEDLYSQFGFLSPSIIGMNSYYSFRNRYCVMGGYDGKQIVGYNNVKELMKMLAPYTIVVTTEEAFPNLPDRIRKPITVEPTKEQKSVMQSLKQEMIAIDGDDTIEIDSALERMLRFQQIAGGHFPFKKEDEKTYSVKPIKGRNPKIEALMDIIDGDANDQKYIIWANFVPEILLIAEKLRKVYGSESVVTFYGETSAADRTMARSRFQKDSRCRFFVGNQSTGGMGIKLSAADVMVYYSNSFKYIDRDQSEERWIDHARVNHMLVIDLILNHKVDRDIHRALSNKEDVASYVAKEISK